MISSYPPLASTSGEDTLYDSAAPMPHGARGRALALIIARDLACLGPRELGTNEAALLLHATPGEPLPSHMRALEGDGAPVGKPEVAALRAWLNRYTNGHPVVLRAALLAQYPYLLFWASVHVQLARQLELRVAGPQTTSLESKALSPAEQTIVQSLAHWMGIPFIKRAGATATSQRLSRLTSVLSQGFAAVHHRGLVWLANSEKKVRPDLLVVSLQPNSTRCVLPAAMKLKEQGVKSHFLISAADPTSRQLVTEGGFSYQLANAESSLADGRAAFGETSAFLSGFGDEAFTTLLDALGFPAWVEREQLGSALRTLLKSRLRRCYFQAAGLQRAFKQIDAKATLFMTNRDMQNELLRDRKHRTKRIFFLQGVVPSIPPLEAELDVELAIVGSALDLDYLERCRIPAAKRRVTGYPDYDHYPLLNKVACREEINRAVPLLAGRRLVVFTSQYTTEVFPEWARIRNIQTLAQAAGMLADVSFLLKAHPIREKISRSLATTFPPNLLVSPSFPTDKALRAADVAVTYWSTTALESVLLGTPLIQLNSTGLPDYFDVAGLMGQNCIRTADELCRAVEFALSPEGQDEHRRKRDAFLVQQQIQLDGQASQRVAAEIRLLLERPVSE